MAKSSALEERLEAITREYLAQVVATIRNASFAEVAGYVPAGGQADKPRKAPVTRAVASPKVQSRAAGGAPAPRQTADKRAELRERLVDTLRKANEPMGVRAIAGELGVAPDLLAAPLRELRDAGTITKHGDKRSTTYSLA